MKLVKYCWQINNTSGSWPIGDRNKSSEELQPALRRRATPLGISALRLLNTCTADMDNPLIPWIISCRHGDKSRRYNLLSNLAKGEMLSPTDFSMSVHNALIGMYSIAKGNKQTHSALAAGGNSFELGILESIALLNEKGGSVGYLYYDYLEEGNLTDRLEDNAQVECFAMVFSEGQGEMTIEYQATNKNKFLLNCLKLESLLNYLKHDEKRYCIPVGGGEILFERH